MSHFLGFSPQKRLSINLQNKQTGATVLPVAAEFSIYVAFTSKNTNKVALLLKDTASSSIPTIGACNVYLGNTNVLSAKGPRAYRLAFRVYNATPTGTTGGRFDYLHVSFEE